MSCGCTTTSSYPSITASGYAQPRRVSSQPIVPVVQSWAAQLRSSFEIELMGHDGDEVLTLDAPISGQVLYNADTRKAYVGNLSATYVADSYPCQTTPLSGMLIYAKDPGCRDLGSNPDRELMVVRPTTGSTGFLFGHAHTCPSSPGSSTELTPVEIEPTALPGTIPDDLYGLYYVRTTSTDSCVPSSYQWYKIAGLPPIDQTKLTTTEVTAAGDLQDVTDGFNFAGWRLVNGKWVAYRVTNESFKRLIVANNTSPTVWLTTPYQALFQAKSYFSGSTPGAIAHFPAIDSPGPLPIVNQTQVVNLTTVPSYFAEATSVKVEFQLKGLTLNQLWDGVLVANDREYARVALPGNDSADCCYNQADIPINGNTNMVFRFDYQQSSGGNPSGLIAIIRILAFNR